MVTGCATIDGRLVHLACQDFTVAGGAAGEVHCAKITDMMKLSMKTGSPFIFVNDSGGARVQEGAADLDDMVSGQVGRHPKAMVALGVGIGFALGILFASSRNREPSWRDYAKW